MVKNKKVSQTKKAPVKKGYVFVSLGIVLLFLLSGYIGYQVHVWQVAQTNAPIQAREKRITDIFASLRLNDSYILQNSNIFGDKRVYDYDPGRSSSSSQTYLRAANVDVTAADLKKYIETAGFVYFDEPYPGSTSIQYHFKSDKNEYIRMSVSSKPRNDAFQTNFLMNKSVPDDIVNMDGNIGPSEITIKVNLDDNNE